MPALKEHPLNTYLSPLTQAWVRKFEGARKAKKKFNDVASQCRTFFKGTDEFWNSSDKGGCYEKYMDSSMRPKVRMNMCKAFELVALFGPMLYYRNPQRFVQGRPGLDVVPDLFPPPQGVPPEQAMQMQQQQIAQVQQQLASKRRVDAVRAQVEERVLNYLPNEQPGNGLYGHSRRAIQEALVTGLGCLWPELYVPPGSDKKMVGSFFKSVDRLLIDAGCKTPDLTDAYWISLKTEQTPAWKLEQEYGLEPGSLKGHAESAEAMSETSDNDRAQDRRDGKTKDLVTYYKVFSKTGIGYRFQSQHGEGLQNEYLKQLDDVVGDYAFLVIVPGIPYPLNMPPDRLERATTEEVKAAFAWPVEYWRDGDWPVKMLTFYEDEKSPWPIAPLRPAIGGIVFINLMLSVLAERGVEGTKEIIGIIKSQYEKLTDALEEGGSRIIVPLDGVNSTLREAMDVWQSSPVNYDVWRIIDAVMHEVERMTGLTDFLQGMQQTQDRSAASSQAKQQQMQLRPDDMAGQVEMWQQRIAVGERLTLHAHVTGQDLVLLLGDYGAWLWDTLVKSQPIEAVLREADVTIEPGSVRKPNKSREAENVQNMSQVVLPMYQQIYAGTGNPQPLNAWLKRMARSIDLEGEDLMVPPPPPPPQQQGPDPAMQAEQMKAQAASTEAQLKMQVAQQQHQMDMQKMAAEAQKGQMDLQVDQLQAKARMEEEQLSAEINRQEMLMRLQEMQLQADQGGMAV